MASVIIQKAKLKVRLSHGKKTVQLSRGEIIQSCPTHDLRDFGEVFRDKMATFCSKKGHHMVKIPRSQDVAWLL